MPRLGALLLVPVVALLGARSPQQPQAQDQPPLPVVPARVLARFPHDPGAFTEGLFIERGELFESTGMVGRSSVRRVDLRSGKVLQSVSIPAPQFGEGIAPWNGQVLSLTWRDGVGYRWDRRDLAKRGSFRYSGEGWALTSTGKELVMSDGTDTLRVIDPATFTEKRRLRVTIAGRPLAQLNELEWVEGEIVANVWMSDYLVRIDPRSGKVGGVIDLTQLHREVGRFGPDQVANGVAWDARTRKLYVTGKEWPTLFAIAWPGKADNTKAR